MKAHGRSDLIVGLCLAELFLLFIALSWIGLATPEASPVQPEDPAQIVRERDSLRVLATALRGFAELRQNPAWPTRSAATDSAMVSAARKALVGPAGRGGTDRPACVPGNNVLFVARVSHGVQQVMIAKTAASSQLARLASMYGAPLLPGTVINNQDEVSAFLEAIDQHCQEHGCRYHFILEFSTNDDFVVGVTRYERHCYVAGRRKLAD